MLSKNIYKARTPQLARTRYSRYWVVFLMPQLNRPLFLFRRRPHRKSRGEGANAPRRFIGGEPFVTSDVVNGPCSHTHIHRCYR